MFCCSLREIGKSVATLLLIPFFLFFLQSFEKNFFNQFRHLVLLVRKDMFINLLGKRFVPAGAVGDKFAVNLMPEQHRVVGMPESMKCDWQS